MSEPSLTTKKTSVFANQNFMLLFFGGLVSRIGNGIHSIGLVWYILEISNSGLAVGTILMLSSLPAVFLSPIAGTIVDYCDRKNLIIWMDVVRGIIVCIMGVMIITGAMNFTYLIIGTIFLSICGCLFNPAVTASIPNIVKDEHLTQANSLEHMSNDFTAVVGPALGGFLTALWGVGAVFLINGISFLISAFSETFIQFPPHLKRPIDKLNIFADIKAGGLFIYNNKIFLYLLITGLFLNFVFISTASVGLPILVHRYLGDSPKYLGLLQGSLPLGATLGALLLSLIGEIKKPYKVIVAGLGLQAFFMLIVGTITLPAIIGSLGMITVLISILVLLILSGVLETIIDVPVVVILQRLIPDNIRGRVFALMATISGGLAPVALGVSGAVVDYVAPSFLFLFRGIGTFIILLFLSSKKEIRKL